MKHLKLFEGFDDINAICKKYRINNYRINPDGTVDVDGDVVLSRLLPSTDPSGTLFNFTKLPIKFSKVTGNFWCSKGNLFTLEGSPNHVGGDFTCYDSQLCTLEGGPSYVGGDFYCNNNKITTLRGGPSYVGGEFSCGGNQLISLEGGPKEVGGNFYCGDNELVTLDGSPKEINGDFYCNNNKLITLDGSPKEIYGGFYCHNNPISVIYNLFGSYEKYIASQDYNYLRGKNIVKSRFEEALREIDSKLSSLDNITIKIAGYNYI